MQAAILYCAGQPPYIVVWYLVSWPINCLTYLSYSIIPVCVGRFSSITRDQHCMTLTLPLTLSMGTTLSLLNCQIQGSVTYVQSHLCCSLITGHTRRAESNKIPPSYRTSASLQGLVQVKYAEAVNSGQQYLRGEAFEFVATLVKYVLSYPCTFCYCCVCIIINCSTSNRRQISLGLLCCACV